MKKINIQVILKKDDTKLFLKKNIYPVLKKELEQEKSRCQNAVVKLEEKARQFQKLQTMYEKLKRQVTTSSMQENFQTPTAQNAPYHARNLIKMNSAQLHPLQAQQHTIILDESDVISKTERAPTVMGVQAMYHQQPLRENRPSRIPSPTRNMYSIRKHRSPSSRKSTHDPHMEM